MQGTFVNVLSIICGSMIGALIGKKIPPRFTESSIRSIGLMAMGLGISWIAQHIPQSRQPLLFMISLVVGNLIGESLQLDQRLQQIQQSKQSTGNLLQGILTATLLFCIGTFSILGPINAALKNDHSLIYTNAMLDGIASIVFASSYGFGIVIVAGILFVWQGSWFLFAHQISPYMTEAMFTELQIIGGFLILGTGLNILKITKIPILNLLPSLFVSFIYMLMTQ